MSEISGKSRPSPGATALGSTLALEGEDLWWVAEPPHGSDHPCGNGEHHLFRVHHPSGVTLRQTPIGIPGEVEVRPTHLYLTESDTLQLFSLARGKSHLWTTYLQEFSREGDLLWTCPLIDVGGDSFQMLSLTRDHVVLHSPHGSSQRLLGFALPGRAPSRRGWSGTLGNPQHTRIARDRSEKMLSGH